MKTPNYSTIGVTPCVFAALLLLSFPSIYAEAIPGLSASQSDHDFLEQVEKAKSPAATPPATLPEERPAAQTKPGNEPASPAKARPKSTHSRPTETPAKAAIAEKRAEPRKVRTPEELTSQPGAPLSANPPRESSAPSSGSEMPADIYESTAPTGTKVTVVTSTFTDADGRIHTIEKRTITTTTPPAHRGFFHRLFGHSHSDREEQ